MPNLHGSFFANLQAHCRGNSLTKCQIAVTQAKLISVGTMVDVIVDRPIGKPS
jgi:hypothetical protein